MSLLDDSLKEYGVVILNIYNEILEQVSYFLGIDGTNEVDGLKDFDRLEASTIVELLAVVQQNPAFPPAALAGREAASMARCLMSTNALFGPVCVGA